MSSVELGWWFSNVFNEASCEPPPHTERQFDTRQIDSKRIVFVWSDTWTRTHLSINVYLTVIQLRLNNIKPRC